MHEVGACRNRSGRESLEFPRISRILRADPDVRTTRNNALELRTWPEVQHQPDAKAGGAKIVEGLSNMTFVDRPGGFQFDQQLVCNHQISSKTAD